MDAVWVSSCWLLGVGSAVYAAPAQLPPRCPTPTARALAPPPRAGQWSAPGSLAEAQRPRLYHSVALLLPDCTVLTGGSDVTWDYTAEIFSPPYLSKGPRPVIDSVAPTALQVGWARWEGGLGG